MGLRFRKTISLGKGVRLNVSKSGVSTSVGPRGASVTFGKNGTYANLGIPGTGISYRKKIGGHASGNGRQPGAAGQAAISKIADYTGVPDYEFQTAISDQGEILFLDAIGNPITDQRLISLLKKHPRYLDEKESLDAKALERSRQHADELQSNTEDFLTIHRRSPRIKTREDFVRHRAEMTPKEFKCEPFRAPMPDREAIRNSLLQEADRAISSKVPWKRRKEIDEFVSSRLEVEYQNALQAWQSSKNAHEASQATARHEFDGMAQERFKKSLRKMDAAISGNESYIEWAVERWMNKCMLPAAVDGAFDYDPAGRKLVVDLQLPSTAVLPKEQAVQLSSGRYKEKSKTQKQLRDEYSVFIHGLMVYITANLFNVSPVISEIVMSGFLAERNSIGEIEDRCIVSVRFERSRFSACDYSLMSPEDTVLKFENRLNLTATKLFKPVQPL